MAEGNGLYYMGARYYDPEVGRFINKDPIGYMGGINLFTYTVNNFVTLIDPWGLMEFLTASGTRTPTWFDRALTGGNTWDIRTDVKIATIQPDKQEQVTAFINTMDRMWGIKLRISHAHRTIEKQNEYYRAGITRLKGGQSYHNYYPSRAFDVVPMVNGRCDYNSRAWGAIGGVGYSFGFKWGGHFRDPDKVHFEFPF
jgi:uncharacterized protein RhaS with RHS repeats